MLAEGVDLLGWPGGVISAAHVEGDLDRTVEAFRRTLCVMREEEEIPQQSRKPNPDHKGAYGIRRKDWRRLDPAYERGAGLWVRSQCRLSP